MILLHRLVAHNFKQLRNVELNLPKSGSVLIEGHNEAGKSSLFEAVFFALFGRPLLSERDFAIEDLKRYGADAMEVGLDFSIGGREFSITRTYGKANRVKLLAPSESGMETISSLSEVRKRLADEMRLSSDALLNTCFVEQKRLERLEDMNAEARRNAINELLNLRVLTDMENHFKITRESRENLEKQKARVALAGLDAELPSLAEAVRQAESSLRVARVREAQRRASELETQVKKVEQQQRVINDEREQISRELEESARLAARRNAIENELNLRAAAWRDALLARDDIQRRNDELQQRANHLPEREAKLKEQKQLAHSLAELENVESESRAAHEFWPRWSDAQARWEAAQEKTRSVAESQAKSSFPKILYGLPILVAAFVVAAGLAFSTLIIAVTLAIIALVVAGLFVDRYEKSVARADVQRRRAEVQPELSALEAELGALKIHRPAILQNKSDEEIESLLREHSARAEPLEEIKQLLRAHGLPLESGALQTRLAVLENELERERVPLAQLESLARETEQRTASLHQAREEFVRAWNLVLENDPSPTSPLQALELLRRQSERLAGDEGSSNVENLRARNEELQSEYSALDRQSATWTHELNKLNEQLALSTQELGDLSEQTEESHVRKSVEQWEGVLEARREEMIHHRAARRAEANRLELSDEPLDLAVEQTKLSIIEEDFAVRRRAGEIVSKTRGGIVSRVMPLTLSNVRRVLPLLTSGRYRDAQWDEESNTLSIYDLLAGDFVRKRVFSGGARDQISLALRLAFALATLPGEHTIRPGFLFLDEPLSSFDRERTQSLVELLTKGLIRQHFAQIFLVSHSQSFDPALFDFRLRMEGGRVSENTLPL